MSKKHHHKPAQVGALRPRVESAAADGRFQHALDLARQLYKQEPTPENRLLLHTIGLGRARQLRQEGRTRDAAATLNGLLQTPGNLPEWHGEIAAELSACGETQQALSLLGANADPLTLERFHIQAADAAVANEKAGRDALPETLRADFDRILTAFRQLHAGQDEAMRETLQLIGLKSPFLEWKVFLRGLQAYYQNDDARVVENWQRLKPERLPARLAAPLRFSLDKDYQAAQPVQSQAALRLQVNSMQASPSTAVLESLRTSLASPRNMAPVFRQAEQAKRALERDAPHLVPRLATVLYWATLMQGEPEDVPRYQRVFGNPPSDPQYHRLHALAWERVHELGEAHSRWHEYEKEIAANPAAWPGQAGTHARSMIWQRMGRNAASVPQGDKLKLIPDFIRRRPDFPSTLKPGAEECFRASIKLAPETAQSYLLLFRFLREQNKGAKAIQVGRELLKRHPGHFEMLTELGGLLQKEQQHAQALEVFEEALKRNPLDRGLRSRVSTAHIYHARMLAEAGKFADARREYQTSLELSDSSKASVLCKWAACEIKAGDAARGEELLQEALKDSSSALSVSYSMAIEVVRLKLPPAVKKRFDKTFAEGLASPPDPAAAAELADTAASHRAAGVEYRGQKSHEKKVLDYLKKAQRAAFTDAQLEEVCQGLIELESYRLARSYTELGENRFPMNPVFPLLNAENEMSRGEGLSQNWRVDHLLRNARALAEKMPHSPRRESLLDRIAAHQKMLEAMNPYGRMFDDFFDPFGRPEDDEEDFEDEWF